MDAEMEIETESTPGSIHGNDNVMSLIELARQLITQGKPTLALQAVVMALRTSGGDTAVFQTLHRARELYRNRLRANAAAEELASLFAECAIAEAHPEKSETLPFDSGGPSMVSETVGSSILAQTGRKQLVLDAFADGSSFICLQCGGLVSNQRREEHLAYWCCQI
ncbi:hypothetical protein MRB53_012084 [Persea americana]|uniref:Uncharacterized protein n=1 Tax=Persea americana TaxID=3435 RepID=A0ACC2LXZ1_PERAE|nr:hypothetical protein MRB53_012084 [Persea americana]|eukprot:TRINITY_DN999_c0_g1_i1.p1 TRINITY_DN999_c0_g1~~TRINITY_DN999_c0_g1_i1.p1  ORF type:complete len:166 (+),score=33.50 TRINITY_DN999_c0_g1_i1:249-746(+)